MLIRLVNIETRNHPLLWLATLAAPFYMTLVNLPYVALTLMCTPVLRSTFFGVALALGYTQKLPSHIFAPGPALVILAVSPPGCGWMSG